MTPGDSDGSLDTAFVAGSGFNLSVSSIAPAIDGSGDGSGDVYVGGMFTGYQNTTSGTLVRLGANGTLK